MLWNIRDRSACRKYLARLEALADARRESSDSDNVALPEDAELRRHMGKCRGCRESLESMRVAGELLRDARPPQAGPDGFFAARVIARIREEEGKRLADSDFWAPIEALSRKLVWTSALVLLLLSSILYEMRPAQSALPQGQETLSDRFPQPVPQPTGKDEVLVSLAERGR